MGQPSLRPRQALLAALLALAACRPAGFEGGTFRPMQEDFDRIRLDHLFILDTLLREYASRTGTLPFAAGTDSMPSVVVIATADQRARNEDILQIRVDRELRGTDGVPAPAPQRPQFHTAERFQAELSRALGRTVVLPVDPQQVPVNKPSVYVYVLYRGVYDVSAFLHQEFGFARALGPYHHKVALAGRTLPRVGIWRREDLAADPAFRAFFAAPFNRGGYVLRTTLPDQP